MIEKECKKCGKKFFTEDEEKEICDICKKNELSEEEKELIKKRLRELGYL